MRAAVHTSFGPPDVVQVVEKPLPTLRQGDVLIRVHATTVTSAECAMRRGEPLWGRVVLGLRRPRAALRTLGLEVSGVVDSVGSAVTRFRPGDEVFGFTGFAVGAHADFVRLPATGSLLHKPESLTFVEAAAAVDGATTALFFLRDKGKVGPGDRVLINGASGSIGTYAVQLAKHLGATVTAVCGPTNVDLVKSLGADEVIDYTERDFTEDENTYDIVFDTVTKSSFGACRRSLRPGGKYLPTTGLVNNFWALWTAFRSKGVMVGMSVNKRATLPLISSLLESGNCGWWSTGCTRWPTSPPPTGTSTQVTSAATSWSPSRTDPGDRFLVRTSGGVVEEFCPVNHTNGHEGFLPAGGAGGLPQC